MWLQLKQWFYCARKEEIGRNKKQRVINVFYVQQAYHPSKSSAQVKMKKLNVNDDVVLSLQKRHKGAGGRLGINSYLM
ncbi:CLUMA_CG021625, isoform A [Clunio marinus]|uniref:CLUMA_CG021625, isoform A n=1 Tax=Clunio marinus TaxID=568069 RepID=A0A1J1J852_9DIPT|nr:CLUMA_CG021625, isoform A [Clunio marinus]